MYVNPYENELMTITQHGPTVKTSRLLTRSTYDTIQDFRTQHIPRKARETGLDWIRLAKFSIVIDK